MSEVMLTAVCIYILGNVSMNFMCEMVFIIIVSIIKNE